jgi:hypothetical protein
MSRLPFVPKVLVQNTSPLSFLCLKYQDNIYRDHLFVPEVLVQNVMSHSGLAFAVKGTIFIKDVASYGSTHTMVLKKGFLRRHFRVSFLAAC